MKTAKRHPRDVGTGEIESFLTDLAAQGLLKRVHRNTCRQVEDSARNQETDWSAPRGYRHRAAQPTGHPATSPPASALPSFQRKGTARRRERGYRCRSFRKPSILCVRLSLPPRTLPNRRVSPGCRRDGQPPGIKDTLPKPSHASPQQATSRESSRLRDWPKAIARHDSHRSSQDSIVGALIPTRGVERRTRYFCTEFAQNPG